MRANHRHSARAKRRPSAARESDERACERIIDTAPARSADRAQRGRAVSEDPTRAMPAPGTPAKEVPAYGRVGPADPHADPATHPGLRPPDVDGPATDPGIPAVRVGPPEPPTVPTAQPPQSEPALAAQPLGRAVDGAHPLGDRADVPARVHPAEPDLGHDQVPRLRGLGAGRCGAPARRDRRAAARGDPGRGADHAAAPGRTAAPRAGDAARRGQSGCRSSAGRGCTSAASRPTTPPTSGTPPRSSGPTSPRGCCGTSGVDVEVCRNVTDVDDVLDAAAARSGSRSDSFAAVQQFRFDRDMTALGVRRPTHEPRAQDARQPGRHAGGGAARGRTRPTSATAPCGSGARASPSAPG